MSYSFALTQKINFYICTAFILLFGLVLTTSIVQAVNHDAPDIPYLIGSAQADQ